MQRELKLSQLKDACTGQKALFKKMFGNFVLVTEALAIEHSDKFDWSWAAQNLLSDSALAEYNKVVAPSRAEYNKVVASARAEYDKVCASARAEYDKIRAPAWAKAYIEDTK